MSSWWRGSRGSARAVLWRKRHQPESCQGRCFAVISLSLKSRESLPRGEFPPPGCPHCSAGRPYRHDSARKENGLSLGRAEADSPNGPIFAGRCGDAGGGMQSRLTGGITFPPAHVNAGSLASRLRNTDDSQTRRQRCDTQLSQRAPDQQRTTPQKSGALRSIRGTFPTTTGPTCPARFSRRSDRGRAAPSRPPEQSGARASSLRLRAAAWYGSPP